MREAAERAGKAEAEAEADSSNSPKRTERNFARRWKNWEPEPERCPRRKCDRREAR